MNKNNILYQNRLGKEFKIPAIDKSYELTNINLVSKR
jgi:hypothetical protein